MNKIFKNTSFEKNLFKFYVFLFFILFSGLGGFVKPYITSFSDYRKHSPNIKSIGTGSFINNNHALTNEHVINGCKKITIIDNKKNSYNGIVVAKNNIIDVAIIKINGKVKSFALFSDKDPDKYDVINYPNYTSTPGKFKFIRGITLAHDDDNNLFKILSPKTRGGNSGSSIYNENGFLVGVLHSLSIFMPYTYASTRSEIIKFATQNNIQIYTSSKKNIKINKMKGYKQRFAVNVLCS